MEDCQTAGMLAAPIHNALLAGSPLDLSQGTEDPLKGISTEDLTWHRFRNGVVLLKLLNILEGIKGQIIVGCKKITRGFSSRITRISW